MSAYPTGGSSNSAAFLSYQPAETIHGMYVGALSSSGQLTLVNDGSHAVDLTVGSEGYLVSPTGPETGSEYVDAPQARVETTTTPVPANGSITFAVEGTDNIPTSGVSAVVENVRAQNPQDTGFLSIYATGASDPGQPGVNFYASQNTGSNLTVPMVSSAGQQTVTNHSNGTVNVTVAVRGYYQAPSAPDPPSGVAATVSGSSATVSWTAPTGDGGSPITGYAVAATPDGATVTVSGTATSATLSNLANAAADTFSVTAVNQIGTSDQATFVLQQVITGTVTAPNGSPVPSDQIQFVTNDGDATSAPVTPTVLGTAVTDGNGRWSFTVPSYASLPADAQASATANNGYLNIDAIGIGAATVTANGQSTNYPETAVTARSVWVGTATQSQAPEPADVATPPTMVMRPNGADMSANYTASAQASTWAAQNNPGATDSSGDIIGAGVNDPTATAPVDAYGYQDVGGPATYNPNVAADGTDLSNVPVVGDMANTNPQCWVNKQNTNCKNTKVAVLDKTSAWTVIGEYHTGWRDAGDLSYTKDATSDIGSYIGFNGEDFDYQFYDRFSTSTTLTSGIGTTAGVDNDSRRIFLNMKYWESKWEAKNANEKVCSWWDQWDEHGLNQPPGGEYIKAGANIWGQLSKTDQNDGKWWREDGFNGLENLIQWGNPHWLAWEPCGWHADLTAGHGVTYGVSADVAGVGIQAETDHSSAVDQSVDTRPFTCINRLDYYTNAHDSRHWVWGYNKALINNPATYYLY